MAVTGTLVAESLAPGSVIEFGLTLRRLQRIAVGNATPDQPGEWTLVDFTCPDDGAQDFAAQLAAAMRAGSWYCDFATDDTKYVVFSGAVMSYPRGDEDGYRKAAAYARSVGVPEAQLDWPK